MIALPAPLRTWLLAPRPKTLPAAVAPVVLGTAAAERAFVPWAAVAALTVAVLLQVGVNLANDVFDFRFLFFGLVAVGGTAYMQEREPSALGVMAAIPVGCLATGILVINNLRDIPTDRVAGKWTLAVRFGLAVTRAEYAALLALAYVAVSALRVVNLLGDWWRLPRLPLPLATSLIRRVTRERGSALNPVLAKTAQPHFLFAGSNML